MAKITAIKNTNNEIIYPKTHEDAVLTDDGFSISTKFAQMNTLISQKAEASHTHTYDSLSGLPTALPASGGNADTVGNRRVNDDREDTTCIWTGYKILKTINDKIAAISATDIDFDITAFIKIANTAPDITGTEIFWIESNTGLLYYKDNSIWKPIQSEITFVEE